MPDATAEDSARGILRAQDQAVLASEINGRVLEMPFRDGESFHRGDLLVRFDCSAYQAQLAAALAAEKASRQELAQNSQLAQMKSVGRHAVALSERPIWLRLRRRASSTGSRLSAVGSWPLRWSGGHPQDPGP